MFDIELLTAKSKIEATENWRGNSRLIPFIKFKPDWEVKMVAPFGGAVLGVYVGGLCYKNYTNYLNAMLFY